MRSEMGEGRERKRRVKERKRKERLIREKREGTCNH